MRCGFFFHDVDSIFLGYRDLVKEYFLNVLWVLNMGMNIDIYKKKKIIIVKLENLFHTHIILLINNKNKNENVGSLFSDRAHYNKFVESGFKS